METVPALPERWIPIKGPVMWIYVNIVHRRRQLNVDYGVVYYDIFEEQTNYLVLVRLHRIHFTDIDNILKIAF